MPKFRGHRFIIKRLGPRRFTWGWWSPNGIEMAHGKEYTSVQICAEKIAILKNEARRFVLVKPEEIK